MPSKLWIIATPLGNPSDLAPRARKILTEADIVLAEDTRRAKKLFCDCNLPLRKFVSFFEHNEEQKEQEILSFLEKGMTVALITDAGTPLIADPGYRLVRACRKNGIAVSAIPGPSAVMAALSVAGIAPIPFSFLGFPPRSRKDREQLFSSFAHSPGSLVFFESKNRLCMTLESAFSILGERELVICRELTKIHEEFIYSSLKDFQKVTKDLLGELTIIIGPSVSIIKTDKKDVLKILAAEKAKGIKSRQAAIAAREKCRGWTAHELYGLLSEMD